MKLLLRCLGMIITLCRMDAAEFSELRSQAEAAYAEGSYARAYQLYRTAPTNLPPAEARWLAFRLPDARWRAQANLRRNQEAEAARKSLDQVFPQASEPSERDLWWAEAQESLGDLHARRGDPRELVKARYDLALDWWAGQSDLETARTRYLALVTKLATGSGRGGQLRWQHDDLDLSLLNRAVEIARRPADIAQFRHFRARHLSQLGPPDERALYLVEDDFLAALQAGKETPWYDDALFHYATWLSNQGRLILPPTGPWSRLSDAPRALERFRQLITEFREGESEYWHMAKAQVDALLAQQLGASVDSVFLPGSEIPFRVEWRNLKNIEWTLRPVVLPQDLQFTPKHRDESAWLQALTATAAPVQRGTIDTRDNGFHNPGSTNIVLAAKLTPGAYLLELTGDKSQARELILVSDVVLTLKTSPRRTVAWLTDVHTGQPVGDARLKLWLPESQRDGTTKWFSQERTSDSTGVASFELAGRPGQVFVSASASSPQGTRQAFAQTWFQSASNEEDSWRLYVFTDRPAYRPLETVHWKLTARERRSGAYRVPPETPLHYEILNPKGEKFTNGVARLNAFGSAWGSFTLGAEPQLGVYSIQFWRDEKHERHIATAELFRSEEYKLPEFEVKVRLPEQDLPGGGKAPRALKLGERLEIGVQADYYAGGAVANAEVELVIHQSPWQMIWPMPREFPWYYGQESDRYSGRYSGRFPDGDQIVKRETLRTDATGRAVFQLETDPAGYDIEFRIEARVRDASRREVTGTGQVRVTRQRYFASARPKNLIPKPGQKVLVEFRTQDANQQPVSVAGTVKITRERWSEIWVDPSGREWQGAELDAARNRAPVWPPPVSPGSKSWRLKHRGYDRDELRTESLTTGTNGVVELPFTPDRDGYYRFAWSSPGNATAPRPADARPRPYEPEVTTETTLWVCSTTATDVGYRSGGVEILLDADTARVGSRLPVMLVTAAPDRWVLFTSEVAGDFTHDVVHVTGTVKLVEMNIEDRHVPNFHLAALSVRDQQLFVDLKEVVVPADKNFLTVEVTPNQSAYAAREAGSLRVTTRDRDGQPVSAEVSVSLVDDSVYAIQPELAGDPRQFFFGEKRSSQSNQDSSFNQRPYRRLLKGPPGRDGELFDERSPIPEEAALESEELQKHMADVSLSRGTQLNPRLAARYGLRPMSAGPFGGDLSKRTTRVSRSASAMELFDAAPAPAAMAIGGMVADGVPAPGTSGALNIVVRSDFRATAFWQPDVKTGADGSAVVPLKYPDSLTRWRATARAVALDTRVGWATTNTQTRSALMVRLQAPRFFVAGDVCVVSSVIMNQTDLPLEVRSTLEATGVTITGGYAQGDFVKENRPPTFVIPARGEYTDNWAVQVPAAGPVKLKVSAVAVAGSVADAMEREYLAHPHGLDQQISVSGKGTEATTEVTLELPAARQPGSTRLQVHVTPSLAITMLDALPYLADYPYGCTEQTLSRFLPAVVVRKTLRDLGLDADAAIAHAYGGITTNAQGGAAPRLGAKKDLTKLDDMVKAGLERLLEFQKPDGSWGWWKEGNSDPWMTAYVVWGLTLAADAGVGVDAAVVSRGAKWLENHLAEHNRQPGTQVWMLHALSAWQRRAGNAFLSAPAGAAFTNLWTQRDPLSAYERALLTLCAQRYGKSAEAATLLRNLENGVIRGDAANSSLLPGTRRPTEAIAHWGQEARWWRWTDGAVESTATTLRALLAVDPKHPLVAPALQWLLKNRRGAQWSNTRDTALSLLALTEHLRISGESRGDVAFAVEVNGREIGQRDLRGKPLWEFASDFAVPADLIQERNQIRLRRTAGSGPLYYTVQGTYFSTAEPVPAAGNELFVRRDYYKLVGRPTLLKGLVYDRMPLRDGDAVKSGERVEAVLTVETKNDYEYLMLEDLKPAGLEAVSITSGNWLTARRLRDGRAADQTGRRDPTEYQGDTQSIYPEWRDRKAGLFADRLPTGFWELRYEFRAEVPGNFHALPVVAQAMYAPELRANSAEIRLRVRE